MPHSSDDGYNKHGIEEINRRQWIPPLVSLFLLFIGLYIDHSLQLSFFKGII
ncbi:MAG: hypothetical protein ACMUEL_02805 [Flavobacteriales bacterium Tduv]